MAVASLLWMARPQGDPGPPAALAGRAAFRFGIASPTAVPRGYVREAYASVVTMGSPDAVPAFARLAQQLRVLDGDAGRPILALLHATSGHDVSAVDAAASALHASAPGVEVLHTSHLAWIARAPSIATHPSALVWSLHPRFDRVMLLAPDAILTAAGRAPGSLGVGRFFAACAGARRALCAAPLFPSDAGPSPGTRRAAFLLSPLVVACPSPGAFARLIRALRASRTGGPAAMSDFEVLWLALGSDWHPLDPQRTLLGFARAPPSPLPSLAYAPVPWPSFVNVPRDGDGDGGVGGAAAGGLVPDEDADVVVVTYGQRGTEGEGVVNLTRGTNAAYCARHRLRWEVRTEATGAYPTTMRSPKFEAYAFVRSLLFPPLTPPLQREEGAGGGEGRREGRAQVAVWIDADAYFSDWRVDLREVLATVLGGAEGGEGVKGMAVGVGRKEFLSAAVLMHEYVRTENRRPAPPLNAGVLAFRKSDWTHRLLDWVVGLEEGYCRTCAGAGGKEACGGITDQACLEHALKRDLLGMQRRVALAPLGVLQRYSKKAHNGNVPRAYASDHAFITHAAGYAGEARAHALASGTQVVNARFNQSLPLLL